MIAADTSHTTDAAAEVRRAQMLVQDARERLTVPSIANLDHCRSRLEEAADGVRALQTGLPGHQPAQKAALLLQLGTLRTEIARLAQLLDSAAGFHTGWVRLGSSLIAGYQADGNPARPEPVRRLSLEI